MISKLRAAKLASEGGVHVAIVNGRHPQAITLGMARKIGTYFPPRKRNRANGHVLTIAASTQEKLLRARAASAKLALLSTEEKNALPARDCRCDRGQREEHSRGEPRRTREFRPGRRHARPSTADSGADSRRWRGACAKSRPCPIRSARRLREWTKSNGLQIRKVRVPLGVIGIIYESRPNVTVDTAVLALKTGNAIVLRGGKEAAQQQPAPGRDHDGGSGRARRRNRTARFRHAASRCRN